MSKVDAQIWINELANRSGKSRYARQAAEAMAKSGKIVAYYSADPETGELKREIIRPKDFYIDAKEARDGEG